MTILADFDEIIDWSQVGVLPPHGTFDVRVVEAEYFPQMVGVHAVMLTLQLERGSRVRCKLHFNTRGGMRVKELAENAAGRIELPRLVNRAVLDAWCAKAIGVRVGVVLRVGEVQ